MLFRIGKNAREQDSKGRAPTESLTQYHDYVFFSYTIDAMKYDYLAPDVKALRHRIVKS
jgi:hypothetical protein